MKYTFYINELSLMSRGEEYKPGDQVLVFGRKDTNTVEEFFDISKSCAACGMGGNENGDIKRFHGWRGTTNNYSITAYGVYLVESVENMDQDIKVTIGRKDLKKDFE